ncbi:MAG TPA: outer membrane beta-barrel protein, partial [Beijerinckiaceae bacterium]
MKRFLLATSALVAMSAAAYAADLPARVGPAAPAPAYAVPIFTWTGFYVGLNAGATFGGGDHHHLRATTLAGASVDEVNFADRVNREIGSAGVGNRHGDSAGFTGGAQIGYNWQFGSMVVGLEADVNYRDGRDSNDAFSIAWVNAQNEGRALDFRGGRGGSNWFMTFRPRVGVALDRTLLYVTGGLAYGGGSRRGGVVELYDTDTDPDTLIATWGRGRRSGSDWGWTLGGGIEHAFSNNWTVKLEYLYVDLDRGGRNDLTTTFAPRQNVVFTGGRNEDNFHVVRVGLNYKFGGASAAPV